MLRIEAQVGEDFLDRRPLQEGHDDLQLAGAAVRAVLMSISNTRLSSSAQLMFFPHHQIVRKLPVATARFWPAAVGRHLLRLASRG